MCVWVLQTDLRNTPCEHCQSKIKKYEEFYQMKTLLFRLIYVLLRPYISNLVILRCDVCDFLASESKTEFFKSRLPFGYDQIHKTSRVKTYVYFHKKVRTLILG